VDSENTDDPDRLPPETLRPGELRGDPLRRALRLITLSGMFWAVWNTTIAGAPVTLYAKSLGATGFEFGVLASLQFVASLVSLPGSYLIERTGRRRGIFLWSLYTQRLLWFPIALLPWWMVYRFGFAAGQHAVVLFLTLMFVMYAGNAIGGPAWTSWVADIIPDRSRGRFFSQRRSWGLAAAVPAAAYAGWQLDRVARANTAGNPLITLQWCAILFMWAAVFGFFDINVYHFVPDVPKQPRRGSHLLRALAGPLRDRQFLLFAGFVATLTAAVGPMAQFVTLYLIDRVGVTNQQVQFMLLVAPMLAQIVFFPTWGKVADRMGRRPVLAVASLGLVPVGLGWCLMSGSGTLGIVLGYVLSMAGAVLWSGVEVANFNMVVEFSGSQENDQDGAARGTAYVAVNSVIVNLAGMISGILWGLIAQRLRDWHWSPAAGVRPLTFFEVLFAFSAALRLAAVLFLPFIHEPSARPAREAVRYMGANIYNNLFNAVLLPVRFAGLLRRESYVESPDVD